MGERHKRERGKAEEDLGGYDCGMCDESGHESGALMTVQKQQYFKLHQPPCILHCGNRAHTHKTVLLNIENSVICPIRAL